MQTPLYGAGRGSKGRSRPPWAPHSLCLCPSDIPTFPAWTCHISVDIPKSLPFVCNCVWVEVCVQTSFFQTRGTLEPPPAYLSLCCASRGSLIQHSFKVLPHSALESYPRSIPGWSFTYLILIGQNLASHSLSSPTQWLGEGAQIGSSPTCWLFLSSQLSK